MFLNLDCALYIMYMMYIVAKILTFQNMYYFGHIDNGLIPAVNDTIYVVCLCIGILLYYDRFYGRYKGL